ASTMAALVCCPFCSARAPVARERGERTAGTWGNREDMGEQKRTTVLFCNRFAPRSPLFKKIEARPKKIYGDQSIRAKQASSCSVGKRRNCERTKRCKRP